MVVVRVSQLNSSQGLTGRAGRRLDSWAATAGSSPEGPGTAFGRATLHQGDKTLSPSHSRSMGPWAAVLAGRGVGGPVLLQTGSRCC